MFRPLIENVYVLSIGTIVHAGPYKETFYLRSFQRLTFVLAKLHHTCHYTKTKVSVAFSDTEGALFNVIQGQYTKSEKQCAAYVYKVR